MISESFTRIGTHMPYMWAFAVLALTLIPVSRAHSGRVWWFCYLIPATCLGLSFLWLPMSFVLVVDMVLFGIGLALVLMKSNQKRAFMFIPSILLMIFAGVIPTLFTAFGPSAFQEILVTRTRVFFMGGTRHDPIERDQVDITCEKAWIGGGSFWDFDGPKEHQSGLIASDDVYYSTRYGLMKGDDVANKIVTWAGTKPRQIVNGDSRAWKNPHPYQQL